MNFKKYNDKHAHLMQTHKNSECYGERGETNSITIKSFVNRYGNNQLG